MIFYYEWVYVFLVFGGVVGWLGLYSGDVYFEGCGYSSFLWCIVYIGDLWEGIEWGCGCFDVLYYYID